MPLTVKVVNNRFGGIAKLLPILCGQAVAKELAEMKAMIVEGMQASTPGPSTPGNMPAIDTHTLVDSLTITMTNKAQGYLWTDVEYATYLEYGTSRMMPRPFMTPASEEGRKGLIKTLSNMEPMLK